MDEGYRLASEVDARQLVLPLPLPEPPALEIDGGAGRSMRLEPLTSLVEVRRHGLEQRNCVGRSRELRGDLIFGRVYLYALQSLDDGGAPVTATVSVLPESDGLGLGDVECAGNRPPPGWMIEALEQALAPSP